MGKQRIELVFFGGVPERRPGSRQPPFRSSVGKRGHHVDGVGARLGLDPEGFTIARVAHGAHRRP